jgi:hypothetical protein
MRRVWLEMGLRKRSEKSRWIRDEYMMSNLRLTTISSQAGVAFLSSSWSEALLPP